MKKPKIFNDITNIFAKLAGSSDYDPRVKYDTALEYYANQIPILPSPKDGDNGKVVAVNSNNAYQLADSGGVKVNVEGTETIISPTPNTIYNCGTLTSLTIINPPATGAYSIVFTSGATATTTTIPATILGLEDFAAEANTIYEINVLNNRAVVGSWAVSA